MALATLGTEALFTILGAFIGFGATMAILLIVGGLFAYGLAQYERDRFQGFSSRYSLSGGLGYKVMTGKAAQLSLQAGPAWRRVDFLDGTSELLRNPADEPLEIIEVQSGAYLGEDDIVRLEDQYDRIVTI